MGDGCRVNSGMGSGNVDRKLSTCPAHNTADLTTFKKYILLGGHCLYSPRRSVWFLFEFFYLFSLSRSEKKNVIHINTARITKQTDVEIIPFEILLSLDWECAALISAHPMRAMVKKKYVCRKLEATLSYFRSAFCEFALWICTKCFIPHLTKTATVNYTFSTSETSGKDCTC